MFIVFDNQIKSFHVYFETFGMICQTLLYLNTKVPVEIIELFVNCNFIYVFIDR